MRQEVTRSHAADRWALGKWWWWWVVVVVVVLLWWVVVVVL